ncbi:MAG TPA: hypothetical protein VJS63_04275 [Bradyrhizobium sp.]|nr:hypothetical protein [Bradyrhizobium sp.]
MRRKDGEIEVDPARGNRMEIGKVRKPPKKGDDDKSKKKPPPSRAEDDDYEDGDIATPKRDSHGNDDEPL